MSLLRFEMSYLAGGMSYVRNKMFFICGIE